MYNLIYLLIILLSINCNKIFSSIIKYDLISKTSAYNPFERIKATLEKDKWISINIKMKNVKQIKCMLAIRSIKPVKINLTNNLNNKNNDKLNNNILNNKNTDKLNNNINNILNNKNIVCNLPLDEIITEWYNVSDISNYIIFDSNSIIKYFENDILYKKLQPEYEGKDKAQAFFKFQKKLSRKEPPVYFIPFFHKLAQSLYNVNKIQNNIIKSLMDNNMVVAIYDIIRKYTNIHNNYEMQMRMAITDIKNNTYTTNILQIAQIDNEVITDGFERKNYNMCYD
ncbi:hypothetical protein EHP00_1831 [Ecytonucleospora hepatopenaei]|uniref:Uncharacterized protein n=1 Tax=Ecytonucleospora hepatopenaei TaxID=646526 RepID=A0A1W0E2U8_9MICR|nr:hypothetical protein EHP00_1831 [Ecytonucleospora hepatopenaei]